MTKIQATALVTGAFGRLGQMVIQELKQRGYRVLAMDLDNPLNRTLAERLKASYDEVHWADLRKADLAPLLPGLNAVVHLGAILPPLTESAPALAEEVNVTATLRLIQAIEALPAEARPLMIYPSSVTVFGYPEPMTRLMQATDSVQATDNYTRHKVAIEAALAASSIPWCVLRVGVSVDARTLAADLVTLRQLFNVRPDNPLEYVHPVDVATAIANSLDNPRAVGRVFLLGGGHDCQVTQQEFMSTAFKALGIALPASMFGQARFYTSWMDTRESQEILQFQQHRFSDYQAEMQARLGAYRWLTAPLAPLVRFILRRLLKS
ncbi:MAG: NAD(P)-dependent oxidoreductase [Sterolibacterium sp.]|nr:NAD(P)-dependent oxidoreductase [Sterolibacterium sp.]